MADPTRREVLAGAVAVLAPLHRRSACIAASPTDEPIVRYEDPRRYRVEHQGVFRAGQADLTEMEMWLPVPLDTPGQEISGLSMEPQAEVCDGGTPADGGMAAARGGHADAPDARVARLRLTGRDVPRPGETRTLVVSYDVVCRAATADRGRLLALPYVPYSRDRPYRELTRDEPRIECRLPGIVEQAAKLRGSRRPAAHVALRAYEWVLDRTDYLHLEEFQGAAYCYDHRHGECSEYSALFVALCRAAGVPARMVTGFSVAGRDNWHVWAEFMLPSGEWIPVDPQIGDQHERARAFHFGSLENRRVALCRTLRIKLRDCREGRQEADFLQAGAAWFSRNTPAGDGEPQATFTVEGHAVTRDKVGTLVPRGRGS
jgi:hypothetical protein